jgi:membrane protease YdiL (CAAX protease family)
MRQTPASIRPERADQPGRPDPAARVVPASGDAEHSSLGGVGFALGLVVAIISAEYVARRAVAPSLPIVGAPVVNDMLASALCYGLLVAIVARPGGRSLDGLGRTLLAVVTRARSWLSWVGGLVFLLTVAFLMPLDGMLWGGVTLPSLTIGPSDTILAASLATPLAIVALLVVNGLVIPIAEERLWRGLIQPCLFASWGLLPSLVVTAVLFSLKHAIVDAALGRLLALTIGGLVLGLVAHRAGGSDGGRNGWQTSAVSHVVANIAGTSIVLATGGL